MCGAPLASRKWDPINCSWTVTGEAIFCSYNNDPHWQQLSGMPVSAMYRLSYISVSASEHWTKVTLPSNQRSDTPPNFGLLRTVRYNDKSPCKPLQKRRKRKSDYGFSGNVFTIFTSR